MLTINPINNVKYNPSFSSKVDYSAIYKEMEKISLTQEDKILVKNKNKIKKLLDIKKLNKKLDKFKLIPAKIIGKIKNINPIEVGLWTYITANIGIIGVTLYLLCKGFDPLAAQKQEDNQTQINTFDKLKKDNTLSDKEFLAYMEKHITNKRFEMV